MARKVETVVASYGRDAGKQFVITEMSARGAEKWALRAMLALGRSGVDLPDDAGGGGIAVLAAVGLRAIISARFEDAEPLLDEMISCVEIVPDPASPAVKRRIMPDDADIEEVATILWLRSEVFRVHVGFSIAAELSKLGAAIKGSNSLDTPTSPEQSEASSPRA